MNEIFIAADPNCFAPGFKDRISFNLPPVSEKCFFFPSG